MVENLLHPIWHRHGPNMRCLSNQIDNGPVIFPALNVVKRQVGQLSSAQTATQQDSQNGSVSFPFQGVWVGELPEVTGLSHRQPIPKSHTQFLCSLHSADAGGKFRTQEPCVRCLVGQASHCRQPDVDGSVLPQLEMEKAFIR
jgi:hypothetical protein